MLAGKGYSRIMTRSARAICSIFVVAALCAFAAPIASAQGVEELAARQAARQADYLELVQQISLTHERVASIEDEVAALKKDNQTLTAALVQAAKTERKLSQEAADITAAARRSRQAGSRRSRIFDVAARSAGRGARRPPAHGAQSAAGYPRAAGRRACFGAQRHPARRRGAGTAGSARKSWPPISTNCRGSGRRSRPSAAG